MFRYILTVFFLVVTVQYTAFSEQTDVDQLKMQIAQLQEQNQMQQQQIEKLLNRVESITAVPTSASSMGYDSGMDATNYDSENDLSLTPMYRLGEMDMKIAQTHNASLYIGLDTVGRYQYITQNDVFITTDGVQKEEDSGEPGFQTAWGNLSFLIDYQSQIAVYFDLYLASRPHPSQVYGHEGYIVIRDLPDSVGGISVIDPIFDYINIKAGAFDIDFGDQQYRRSNNASVQRNPLIGNYVVDPSSEEIGVEIFSNPSQFNWLVGVTSGGTTGDFKSNKGLAAIHAKIWADVVDSLRLSGSFYKVDHSDNPPKFVGSGATMFASNRSGGPYDSIVGGGNSPGQVTVGAGQDLMAFQGDVTWNPIDALEIYGHFGWAEDADTNGSLPGEITERWYYYAVEGIYDVTENLYGAIRYSGAMADKLSDVDSDGIVHRIQVGGGYWIIDGLLFKLEYVYQTYNDFTQDGGQVSGVDAWEEPSFNGVISEISYSF